MDNELLHYGIKRKSGRYPYGSGERPFQGLSFKARAKKKSELKAEKEAERKGKLQEDFERDKEQLLKTGRASDALKYQGLFTNQELQTIVTRLNLEKTLKDYSSKEIKSSIQKMDELMNTVGKVTDWSSKGIKAYNLFADTYNSVSGNPKKLTTIKLSGGGDGKKKKK